MLLLVGPVGASDDVSRASASLGPALLVFCSVFFQQPLQVQSRMGRSGTNWSFVGFFLSVRVVLDYSVGVVLDYCPLGCCWILKLLEYVSVSFVFNSYFSFFLQWKLSLRQTVPLQSDLQG